MSNDCIAIDVLGDGVFAATAGDPSEFVVKAAECQEEHVTSGLVVAFDGPEEPFIEFDHLKDGNIAVRYRPFVPGVYILTLKYNGKLVRGCPFRINVDSHGAPYIKPLIVKRNIVKKVKLSGLGMQEGHVNKINEIYIDISHAEINFKRDLIVIIDGPMKPKYSIVEHKGIITLSYIPTLKGDYSFIISFHFEHVPGSPFTVSVN